MTPTRLVIVDDSTFIREGISRLLEDEPRIEIVGTAATGEELLDQYDRWDPDVVTLDLNMPGMGGLETLDKFQQISTIPVIILSTTSGEGAPLTVDALGRGAVDFIDKEAYSLVDFHALREVLVQKILSVSESSVVELGQVPVVETPSLQGKRPASRRSDYELVVIGASTGGPSAVERVLTDFGSGIHIPTVVAQHMPARFTTAFAERLNGLLPFSVREVADQEPIVGGEVYIAPGDRQLNLKNDGERVLAEVSESPANAVYHPSVDVLFTSAMHVFGDRVVAVLLTGMGDDGAQGMALLENAGAHTIAQDQDSCVVYGMPRVAVGLNAVREIYPLDGIGRRIRQLLSNPGV